VAGLLDRDGVIALGILLSSRLSRLGVYTVSEMLENRYGATSRLISTIIAVTSTIAIGTVFNVVLSLSSSVAILVAGGLVVAYSVAGGMWSINRKLVRPSRRTPPGFAHCSMRWATMLLHRRD
jgi:Na+(H+)/acetate symporter ActP